MHTPTLKHFFGVSVVTSCSLPGNTQASQGQSHTHTQEHTASGALGGAEVQSQAQISLDSCSVSVGPTADRCVTAATLQTTTAGAAASIALRHNTICRKVNKGKQRMLLPLQAAGRTAVHTASMVQSPELLQIYTHSTFSQNQNISFQPINTY